MTSAQSASRWAALVLASGLLLALPAAPAFAASSTVTSLANLQTVLADCTSAPNTISLGADISSPTTEITIPCNTTLNLGTFDLAVRTVSINPGVVFTVTGPTDGSEGTLTANADVSASSGTAGIRTTGATLTVTGGKVIATARATASGIGGGYGQNGGTLNVSGGSVSAYGASGGYGTAVGGGYLGSSGGTVNVTGGSLLASTSAVYGVAVGGGGAAGSGDGGVGANITVTGGTLTAVATGQSSTAIGGGIAGLGAQDRGGQGGSLIIGAAGEVVASSPRSALGGGYSTNPAPLYGYFGTVQVDGILRLPSGTLTVGDDPAVANEIVVGTTGKILGGTANAAVGASIAGGGQISNLGAITLNPPSAMVSGNNKLMNFSTGAASVRVFAPSFATGVRTLPAPSSGTAWNTAADGSGTWFTTTSLTAGSGTLTLYAVAPATLVVSAVPEDLVATAGEAFVFPVTVNGTDGSALSPQPTVTYTSTDCTIVGGNVFEVAGSCSITGSVTVQGVALQTTFTVTVVPGALASLSITPSTDTVAQGESITFTVEGEDAEGNSVDVAAATLVSSVATDTVSGRDVTFSGAGSRAVTASLGSVSESATIEVVAGPLGELTLSPSAHTVVQGDSIDFTVTGEDAAGNPVDAAAAVLTSTVASDVVSGHSVTFSGSGSRVITATLGSVSTTSAIEVNPGPLTELSIAPNPTSAVQGATVAFTVSGEDAAGNPVDVSAAVVTSSAATDTVAGHSVTFSGAGFRVITATLSGVTATATVEVVAGPLASLTISPSSQTVTQGDSVVFTVTGADAAGNPVDVTDAVLTSAAAADTIGGRSVTFSGAGSRVVSATLDGVSTTATIDVIAGPLASLTVIPAASTVIEGGTVTFTVAGEDAAGNSVDVAAAVLTSSASDDTVADRAVTFSGAGSHVITATLGAVTASANVSVSAGPVSTLTITPSATKVDQGGSLAFTVSGEDAAGNPVSTSDVVLTSSVATDVVSGLSVTFPHASPHTITATLGEVSASVTVEVIPAATPVVPPAVPGLAVTGADGGATILLGVGALALLLAGGILLLVRRSARQ